MTLAIDLPPDLEKRLKEEAARHGQAPADYARAVIEEKLSDGTPRRRDPYAGLPRRDPQELIQLARQQGAQVPLRFDELKGSFWPEDEDADEFLATLREWRRE
jgi:plasmid stability protein